MADGPEPQDLAAEASKLEQQLAALRERLARETDTVRKQDLETQIGAVQGAMNAIAAQLTLLAAQSRETFDPDAAGRQIDRFRELGEDLIRGFDHLPDLDRLKAVVSDARRFADSLLTALGGGGARRWPPK